MTDTLSARDLARELADTHDIDHDSALESVEIYLDQIEQLDHIDIDRDDISDDHADTVRDAFDASTDTTHVSALDELAEVRDKLDTLTKLQDERARLIRKALAGGARVVDIVAASGLTRARIYQVRDGR
ncbi:hypothetical protein AB0331_18175 [Dietzia maris]|uniref:hypothetical protein n=1 Tax=Dietzia maris TaxID=37915 RepID=UPI00344CF57A